MRARWLLLAAGLVSLAAPAWASPFSRAELSLEPAELDAALKKISGSATAKARLAAARQLIDGTGAADAPLLHRRLHRITEVAATDYRNVLRSLGAHVPDSRGRFGTPPAKPVDWLSALLEASARGPLAPALKQARTSVALMRALAGTGRSEAAVSLLRFAYRHQGAFRDECGRLLRQMGDVAVPALVRASALRDPLAFKMRRYAAYQLDRMNRARPELALRAAAPLLRVDLLHAYGEVRATAAVNAVLDQTNAESPEVRQAARWAMLRYVGGRPPKAVRRHLKLAGGRRSDVQRSLYLTYLQLAHRALARRLAQELAPDSEAERKRLREKHGAEDDPRALAARLFAHFDAQRFKAQQSRYLEGQRLARAGKAREAMAAFDRLLLDDPDHPHAPLMAPVFRDEGLRLLEAGKPQEAALLLTKAMFLARGARGAADRQGPAKARDTLRAQRAVAEAERDRLAGLGGQWRLAEARALAPELPLVRRALARTLERRRGATIMVAGGGGTLVLLGLAGWIWRRRRARLRTTPRPAGDEGGS